jgi:hypothetical protein
LPWSSHIGSIPSSVRLRWYLPFVAIAKIGGSAGPG